MTDEDDVNTGAASAMLGRPEPVATGRVPRAVAGVVPPLCTPLTKDFEVDVASLERLVDTLLAGGVNGVFALGSTGEVAFLPDRLRRTVIETVVGRVAGRVPVLAGVIDTTTLRMLEHAREAAALGADAIVATGPFYARTHPAEIERHFRFLGERVDLPLYAYDVPVSVHSKLDPAMLCRLAAEGLLAGVKDSSGDADGMRRLLLARREQGLGAEFAVMTGSELTVDAAVQIGADGSVPGLGNVDPAGYARLFAHARAGDWAAAREEQERLVALYGIVDVVDPARMGRGSAAMGAFKAALHLLGVIDCAVTAPPQLPLNDAEIAAVRQILIRTGLL